MYLPSDIKSPKDVTENVLVTPDQVYLNSLGKSQYEVIAQVLVDSSQRAGRWVALPLSHFVPFFQSYARSRESALYYLEQMSEETALLKRKGKTFKLTDRAIERMVLTYPAS